VRVSPGVGELPRHSKHSIPFTECNARRDQTSKRETSLVLTLDTSRRTIRWGEGGRGRNFDGTDSKKLGNSTLGYPSGPARRIVAPMAHTGTLARTALAHTGTTHSTLAMTLAHTGKLDTSKSRGAVRAASPSGWHNSTMKRAPSRKTMAQPYLESRTHCGTHWHTGTLVHRHTGTLVHWHTALRRVVRAAGR